MVANVLDILSPNLSQNFGQGSFGHAPLHYWQVNIKSSYSVCKLANGRLNMLQTLVDWNLTDRFGQHPDIRYS